MKNEYLGKHMTADHRGYHLYAQYPEGVKMDDILARLKAMISSVSFNHGRSVYAFIDELGGYDIELSPILLEHDESMSDLHNYAVAVDASNT